MSDVTLPLSKGYNPKKITFPCFVSEKVDGVPVRIDINHDGEDLSWSVRTRQGEDVPSCHAYIEVFIQSLINIGVKFNGAYTFIAEVSHDTYVNFKDISGVVRRQEPQEGLVFNFFDFEKHGGDMSNSFHRRTMALKMLLQNFNGSDLPFKYIDQMESKNEADLQININRVYARNAKAEGAIVRSGDATFKPATRHWDYQKYLVEPTEDCAVIRYEEAHAADGTPKGMVGAMWVDYKGKEQRVGAGKMSHKERKYEWSLYGGGEHDHKRICEIKHKGDESYDGLRQGTFQHWRPDKV